MGSRGPATVGAPPQSLSHQLLVTNHGLHAGSFGKDFTSSQRHSNCYNFPFCRRAYWASPTRPGLRAWSRLVLTTGLGLWLGAVMSRNMAQILEENELFVPSDDDDDD